MQTRNAVEGLLYITVENSSNSLSVYEVATLNRMVLPTRLWERGELANYLRAKISIYARCEIRHLPHKESSSFVAHN